MRIRFFARSSRLLPAVALLLACSAPVPVLSAGDGARDGDGHYGDGRYGRDRLLPGGPYARHETDRFPHDGDGRYVHERPYPRYGDRDRQDRGDFARTRVASVLGTER